jgi:hypothetical protein
VLWRSRLQFLVAYAEAELGTCGLSSSTLQLSHWQVGMPAPEWDRNVRIGMSVGVLSVLSSTSLLNPLPVRTYISV